MLPFMLPLWETDATLRGAVQQSIQASVSSLGSVASLTGGELAADVRAAGARSLYTAEARVHYARMVALSPAADHGPPTDTLDADASGTASFITSPRSSLAFSVQGSLATTWAARADTPLLILDPFLDGQRIEYGLGANLAYVVTPESRGALNVDAGVAQNGALAADVPAAVGIDSVEGHGGLSYDFDIGPRASLTPELRYTFTHYTHAIEDVNLHRGPAESHVGALVLGVSCRMTPRLTWIPSAGVSVGSAMPILHTRAPVVAPESGITLRWSSRRAHLNMRYAYAYTSLGPRIGAGQQHSVAVRVMAWPFAGAARDVLLRGLVRAAYGTAPLATDPAPLTTGVPTLPPDGLLSTTTWAGRVALEVPLMRGLALAPGLDMKVTHGWIAPAEVLGTQRLSVTVQLTVGIAATLSTDRRRTVPRSPGADEDEAARRLAAPVTVDRSEDRTRSYLPTSTSELP